MRTPTHRIRSGFTLLEVMISMAIFSIGALGVLGMVTLTLQLNQNSRQSIEASQLAIRQMEKLQTLPLSPVPAEFSTCPTSTRCYLTNALAISTTESTIQPASLLGANGAGAGSRLHYELTWRVSTGVPRYLEVVVYWPKNRDQGGADWSGLGLNCAGSNNCYSAQFYSYR